jgi:hypothetical protein
MRTRVALGCAGIGLAMAVGLLAACGGGGGAGTANAAPSGGRGGPQAFRAYADCLSQHGVTIPLPSRGARPSDRPSGVRPSGRGFGGGFFGSEPPPGVDQSTWDAAQKACASLRPSFGPRDGGGSAFRAYRNCLREHGVMASNGPGDVNTADPKVAAALATCAPLRPSVRPAAS